MNKDLGLVTAYAYAVSKGYTGTEEEFAELMASYATVAEQAEESAEDSEAYAVGKRGGADVGTTDETYHNNSKYYAEQAATDASTASSAALAAYQSEQNAAASASTAAQSATDAAASKNTAVDSASTAAGHATNAASSATAASGSATAAANSATAAGNAQAAAETAQGKAEDAQEAAEQAQSDAETAAQSVSQSATQISQNTSDISDLKSALNVKANNILSEVTGNPATFDDAANNVPIKSMVIGFMLEQDGTGEPSYSNMRNIIARTGCSIAQTVGNNVINIEDTFGTSAIAGNADIINGVLNKTHKSLIIDGVTTGHKFTAISQSSFIVPLSDSSLFGATRTMLIPKDNATQYGFLCNLFAYGSDLTDCVFVYVTQSAGSLIAQARFKLSDTSITTVAQANAYFANLAANGKAVEIAYPLKSVETVGIPKVSAKSYSGLNEFTSNYGNLLLQYAVDLQTYIDNRVTGEISTVTPIGRRLRLCSYNMHRFGMSSSVADVDYENTVITGMKKFFNSFDFDIIGGQETPINFVGLGKTVDEILFTPLFPSSKTANVDVSLKSKYAIKDFAYGIFDVEDAGTTTNYCTGTINVSGIDVFIASIHFTSGDILAKRQAQYAKLLEMLADKNYFIVFGDWNAGTQSGGFGHEQDEYNILINAGCNVANGGYFGLFRHTEGSRVLDNIATSSNIIITKAYYPNYNDTLYSDHWPFAAEIVIN